MSRLQAAILPAFTVQELRQILMFSLNTNIDEIVSTSASITNVVFELLLWGKRTARTSELIEAIGKARTENGEIQAIIAELNASPVDKSPANSKELKVPTSPTAPKFESREDFITTLGRLSQNDFGSIRMLLKNCWGDVDDRGAVRARVNQLVQWSEALGGPGLKEVYRAAHRVLPKVFGSDDSFLE